MHDLEARIRDVLERIVADAPEPPELSDLPTVGELEPVVRSTYGQRVALAAAAVVVLVGVATVSLLHVRGPVAAPGNEGTAAVSTTTRAVVDTTTVSPVDDWTDVVFLIDPAVHVHGWQVAPDRSLLGTGATLAVLDHGAVATLAAGTLSSFDGNNAPAAIVIEGLPAGADATIGGAIAAGTSIPGMMVILPDGSQVELTADRLVGAVARWRFGVHAFIEAAPGDRTRRQLAWLGIQVLEARTGRAGAVTGAEASAVRNLAVGGFGRPDLLEGRWRRLTEQACSVMGRGESLDPVAEQFTGEGFDIDQARLLARRIVEVACPETIPWEQAEVLDLPAPASIDLEAGITEFLAPRVPAGAPDPEVLPAEVAPLGNGVVVGPDGIDEVRKLVASSLPDLLRSEAMWPPYAVVPLVEADGRFLVVAEGGHGKRELLLVSSEGAGGVVISTFADAEEPSVARLDPGGRPILVWPTVPDATAWVELRMPALDGYRAQVPVSGMVFFAVDRPMSGGTAVLQAIDRQGDTIDTIEIAAGTGG